MDNVRDLAGIHAAGGNVNLAAMTGDITIANTAAANDVEGRSMSITVTGSEGTFKLNSGAHIEMTTDAWNTLRADKMVLDGTISAGGGLVALMPHNARRMMDLGSTTDLAADTLELSDVELDRITANELRIGDSTVSSIAVADISQDKIVDLNSAGTISVGGTIATTGDYLRFRSSISPTEDTTLDADWGM